MSILTAVAIVRAIRALQRRLPSLARPAVSRAIWTAAVALVLWGSAAETVRWLGGLKRADTRGMASDWLTSTLPRGTRLALENSGPTYLDSAGFRVVLSEVLIDHPLDWYRERADYLVISGADLSRYADLVGAGPTVFQITPGPQRWGPPIR